MGTTAKEAAGGEEGDDVEELELEDVDVDVEDEEDEVDEDDDDNNEILG